MRFVAAIAGISVSIAPLLFFWIGAQPFVRPFERALAVAATIEMGALLIMSVALLFTPSAQRPQGILLITTIATIVIIFGAYRLFR